jgi:hypothetical protein
VIKHTMEDAAIEDVPKKSNWPIYLYIPNLIGKHPEDS